MSGGISPTSKDSWWAPWGTAALEALPKFETKADEEQKQANAEKTRAEADKLRAEAEKIRAETAAEAARIQRQMEEPKNEGWTGRQVAGALVLGGLVAAAGTDAINLDLINKMR